jgi:uncharacterized protein YndB with AHSA1/START domain
MADPEETCLVIADISGYTRYLAGVEIDHAQDVLADLISTVVTSLRPTLRLAKLEGDAAFCFAPADTLDGSILLDTIERCYFGFRRRRRDVRQATSCECNACSRIPDLNLKFVAHHGVVVRREMLGQEELLGSDVIVVHRLLKNDVADRLGMAAYALFSDQLIGAMEVQPEVLGMRAFGADYPDVGQIKTWVHDLDARWQEEESRQRVFVGPEDALFESTVEVPAPPQVVWEFATTPGRRVQWQAGIGVTNVEQSNKKGGRRGVGMVSHCMHGEGVSIEEILDWRPFDYFTDRSTFPDYGISFVTTMELQPTASGTIVHSRVQRPEAEVERQKLEQMAAQMGQAFEATHEALRSLAGEEATARQERVTEPELPASRRDGPLAKVLPIQILE